MKNYFNIKSAQIEGFEMPPTPPMPPATNSPIGPSSPISKHPKSEPCPKCGGELSDWERTEVDAFNQATERHYTKPGNSEYRVCLKCGHEEEKEIEELDAYDLQQDRDLMKGASYFEITKESQFDSIAKARQIKQLLDDIAGEMNGMDENSQEEIVNWLLDIQRTINHMM